jgi:phage gp46-like protein
MALEIRPFDTVNEPQLAPDLVFDAARGVADFALAGMADAVNPGGLQSRAAILTAVVICLFTDRRVEAIQLRDGDVNRGWPGDSFDLRDGDDVLGSRLWLLRRRALDDAAIRDAEDFAREALQPLVDQGLFVRFDVTVTADKAARRLDLLIEGFGRDGTRTFDNRFGILWDQTT